MYTLAENCWAGENAIRVRIQSVMGRDPPAAAQTITLPRTRAYVSVEQFSLEVIEGPDRGASFASTTPLAVVGTHAGSTWRLADKAMSRFHCRLDVQPDGRVRLTDLGSRNGTRVNGVWVEEAWLENQATLRLGRNLLTFKMCETRHRREVSELPTFGEMVGGTPAMRAVFLDLERAATTDTTVLLLGETGTGKDLAAEAIHRHSPRQAGPLVIVDCASLSPQLMQSELFGHVRGAFTGAVTDRCGAFEAAAGGTVFLDEVGELPLELQPQLLRVLEAREITRVGDTRAIPVDVRIIAATHRDLHRMVNQKQFRSDLFFRIAVIPISLPPLRHRLADLPHLVATLCDQLHADEPTRARLTADRFIADLARHDWPGNIRELRNFLERAAIVEDTGLTEAVDSVPSVDLDIPLKVLKERWAAHLERNYLAALLQRSKGNVGEVAQLAGLSRMQIYRMLAKHGMRKP